MKAHINQAIHIYWRSHLFNIRMTVGRQFFLTKMKNRFSLQITAHSVGSFRDVIHDIEMTWCITWCKICIYTSTLAVLNRILADYIPMHSPLCCLSKRYLWIASAIHLRGRKFFCLFFFFGQIYSSSNPIIFLLNFYSSNRISNLQFVKTHYFSAYFIRIQIYSCSFPWFFCLISSFLVSQIYT